MLQHEQYSPCLTMSSRPTAVACTVLTNMQLFVVNVLQFHLTAFTRDFECLSEKTSDSIKLKLQRMQKLTISQIYHELSFISLIRDLTIYDGNLDDDGGG